MKLIDQIRAVLGTRTEPATPVEKLPISHRPDLSFRDHILVQTAAGETQSLIDSYADFATVYKVHIWVRKAITTIANNIAPLPVRVVDDEGKSVGHELDELFNKPNDTTTGSELWEQYVVDMMLGGEWFGEIVPDGRGRPVEIWTRRPDAVLIAPDTSRPLYPRVAAYKFGSDEMPIDPAFMIHDRFRNPKNLWRGIAPITAIRSSLVIDMFAASWSKTFLRRGARPDYAVLAKNGLTPTERDDIEQQLELKFSGPDNWHRPMVLSAEEVDVKALSFPPKDIEWLEQRKFARDEIGAIFGVPDEVMGYGRDTYENMEAAHRWLWLLTLIPLIGKRDDRLTKHFSDELSFLKPGQRIETDLTGIGAIQDDVTPKIESATKLFAMGVPFNVINEMLGLGIGEIPGGDVGYLPFNLMPVGSSADNGSTEPPVTESLNTRQFSMLVANQIKHALKTEPDDDPPAVDPDLLEAAQRRPVPYASDLHKTIWSQFVRRSEPHINPMIRKLKREFQRQQSETLRLIRDLTDKPTVSELFNPKSEGMKFADKFRENLERVVNDFGNAAFDDVKSIKQPPDPDLLIGFDVTDPQIQRVIDSMAFKFGRDINKTTATKIGEAVRPILDQAAIEGWSIPRMQTAIYSEVSLVFDVRKSPYETERIARTEINRAANTATIEGWRESRVVQGKQWLAALDDRTRDSHRDAHNTYQKNPIPLNADFSVGGCSGPNPGATGCAGEDINCRCTMIAVLIR